MLASNDNEKQSGSSLIEAAIAIPLVIFLLFGIIQWGMILSNYVIIRSASATGARMIALGNPAPVEADIISAARSAVSYAIDPNQLVVTIIPRTWGVATPVSITCRYTMPLLVPLVVPGSSGGNYVITSTTVGK